MFRVHPIDFAVPCVLVTQTAGVLNGACCFLVVICSSLTPLWLSSMRRTQASPRGLASGSCEDEPSATDVSSSVDAMPVDGHWDTCEGPHHLVKVRRWIGSGVTR